MTLSRLFSTSPATVRQQCTVLKSILIRTVSFFREARPFLIPACFSTFENWRSNRWENATEICQVNQVKGWSLLRNFGIQFSPIGMKWKISKAFLSEKVAKKFWNELFVSTSWSKMLQVRSEERRKVVGWSFRFCLVKLQTLSWGRGETIQSISLGEPPLATHGFWAPLSLYSTLFSEKGTCWRWVFVLPST